MSELLNQLKGVKQIPVFPLPLVLLPNELLPLHIFEPRYRQMLVDIEADQKSFGIVRFEPTGAGDARPAIGTIGCLAEVREAEQLPDGASNIVTIGIMRYRLLDYVDSGTPYLVGGVEFFEDVNEGSPDEVDSLAAEVHALFQRVAKAAFDLSGSRGRFPDIPKTEPEPLSFLIATAFNLDNEMKYEMLETDSTRGRLEKLKAILMHTVEKMEDSAEIHKVAQTNGHSHKKINF